MRALICRAWGGLDELHLEEIAAPTPAAGQILLEVAASACNYADAIMVSGNYQTRPPFPFAPGLEAAGRVLACGDDVTRFRPGDRVLALLHHGGMAEQAVAEESDAWLIPDGMDFDAAGAFAVAYISSAVALQWQGRLEAGETLLVLGAAGGVGLTAIEIARCMGARVIAAASTAEKLDIAASRGANALINYTTENLKEAVMALTDGRGADVCFDPVGGTLFDGALSSLGWGGRYVHVGFVGGVPQVPANRLLVKHRAALGSSLRYFRWHAPDKLNASVADLMRWYAAGSLQPLISARLPLERGVEALRMLTERRAVGRVLVLPSSEAD